MRARLALCLAAASAALLGVAAPAAAQTECRNLTSCSSRTSPWIAVPPQAAVDEGLAGPASYAFPCPTGRYAAGFDWEPVNVDELLLDVPYNNWGATAPVFLLRTDDRRPGAAQIDIGCVPTPAGSRTAPLEAGATLRMTERRVRPARELKVRQRCEAGETATQSGGALLFETVAAPTQRLLRGFALEVSDGRAGASATVLTEEYVGDDERVVLHVYAVCV
ncbi:MAG TPA: hypothetical protein VIL49_18125 [Capillimicrobium sp.]